ncbi:hypothetical protein RND81_10G063300 [Saponaria officinalis]|uniref:Uncharacterized protein n=1 Tax=Saponaria officinalis TaxID=3572 RepID=A0AAW1I1C5_SAPOF
MMLVVWFWNILIYSRKWLLMMWWYCQWCFILRFVSPSLWYLHSIVQALYELIIFVHGKVFIARHRYGYGNCFNLLPWIRRYVATKEALFLSYVLIMGLMEDLKSVA